MDIQNSDTIVLALLDALTSKVNINYIAIQTTYLVLQDTYGCSNLALFLLTALYLRTTSPQDTYISHILWNATSFFTLKNLQRLLRTLLSTILSRKIYARVGSWASPTRFLLDSPLSPKKSRGGRGGMRKWRGESPLTLFRLSISRFFNLSCIPFG
jgi:hypothetical protein